MINHGAGSRCCLRVSGMFTCTIKSNKVRFNILIARAAFAYGVVIFQELIAPQLKGISRAVKFADNTESTEQSVTMPGVETGRMNSAESFSTGSTLAVHSKQPAPVIEVERQDLTSFFAVGILVNIAMIAAYFFWAYKQWGKAGASDLRQAQDDRE